MSLYHSSELLQTGTNRAKPASNLMVKSTQGRTMKKNLLKIIVIFLFLSVISFGPQVMADTFRVFYLAGQSNMEGYGRIDDLPGNLNKEFDNVWIFHGNSDGDGYKEGGLGVWAMLKPGHGSGFESDGKTNDYWTHFGPELSFARKIRELYPNEKIALIKYARIGTPIDSQTGAAYGCWEPDFKNGNGINQYDHFLTTIRNAMAVKDIDGNGKEDRLIKGGLIWMQGGSDAHYTEEIANRYYTNLKRLMTAIRTSLQKKDLPVVIGKLSDSGMGPNGKALKYGELVQKAQEKYVKTDPNAVIVRSTLNYKYSGPWHFNSAGYIDLGIQFADAIYQLK